MEDIFIVAIVAIASLTCLGSIALQKGINGKLLTTVTGAITGIMGFCVGQAI